MKMCNLSCNVTDTFCLERTSLPPNTDAFFEQHILPSAITGIKTLKYEMIYEFSQIGAGGSIEKRGCNPIGLQ